MPPGASTKPAYHPRQFFSSLITVLVVAIILCAMWLSGSSIMENMRFAKATDQILALLAATRDNIAHDKSFAMQPGENLIQTLARLGQLESITGSQTAGLTNPWNGDITLTAPVPSSMRLETDVPVRDCRRLAQSFLKDAVSLGLQSLEARQPETTLWRQFYSSNQTVDDARAIEAACGPEGHTILALVFQIRAR